MHKKALFSLLIILLFSFLHPAYAQEGDADTKLAAGRSTTLPLPRFASLKSDKVFVRTGPAQRYPLRWVYERARLPVEIVQEFETWRKIRDMDGDEGWVHQTLLSGSRTAIVREARDRPEPVRMTDRDNVDSRLVARIEPGVIVGIDKCGAAFCRVEAGGYKGWVERSRLWGIYAAEELN